VVDVDGQQAYSGVAEPGFSEVDLVTVDARVESAAPGNVKIYRNEKAVDLVVEEGLGVVEMKVEQKPVESNANAGGTPNANSGSAAASGTAAAATGAVTGGEPATGTGTGGDSAGDSPPR
jgi:hypothetical protein